MKIKRLILVFEKNGNKLVKEIVANDLNEEIIKMIFKSKEDDPDFYHPYLIDESKYKSLIDYEVELRNYPYSDFEFYLEAVTVE